MEGYNDKYTLAQLEAMPTLAQSQADDLKVDWSDGDEGLRIWLSRCTVQDGEPYDNKVTVEIRDPRGNWITAYEYQAL